VGDRIDIFNPTPPQAQHLLDLLQRADCSIDDIAQALRTSVAALTVYLASDEAIEILAQAELANARRGRLAATAQLDKCAHALSLILDGYISDTTTAVRRDTPKNRSEDLIHQESARRAATQLFKIANFTPRIFTSQLNTNPTRKRGVTTASNTTAATHIPTASPPRLLAPRERGEVAESARPVRGRDVNELQPASIDAQPNESPDALNSPSPVGVRDGPRPWSVTAVTRVRTGPAPPAVS
jgi:AcrR family transcriptional regulator